jgi:hypothetical protein
MMQTLGMLSCGRTLKVAGALRPPAATLTLLPASSVPLVVPVAHHR